MAAVDYARLRSELPRSRLLFVAHREEILDQSRATFRHALRDAAFGEKWVGGQRPERFEHVFASIQSLRSADVRNIDPTHFDVVIVDEFHHAAAPSYEALLEPRPAGRVARPDRDSRARGRPRRAPPLRRPNRRRAAASGTRSTRSTSRRSRTSASMTGSTCAGVPWRRGQGYDIAALDERPHRRSRVGASGRRGGAPEDRRSVDGCGRSASASASGTPTSWPQRFTRARDLPSVAVSGRQPRRTSGRPRSAISPDGTSRSSSPSTCSTRASTSRTSTRCLLLRPTDSPTLFLQQLGRGCARREERPSARSSTSSARTARNSASTGACAPCSVDRGRCRAAGRARLPVPPAGCHLELDAVARERRPRGASANAIPTGWRERCDELRSLGDVSAREYLRESGLELEDVYAANHSWSEMRRAVGLPTAAGRTRRGLAAASGRTAAACRRRRTARRLPSDPRWRSAGDLGAIARSSDLRRLRMLARRSRRSRDSSARTRLHRICGHIRRFVQSCVEVLELLRDRVSTSIAPLGLGPECRSASTRVTRAAEILAAFGVGAGRSPPTWQTGVWWDAKSRQTSSRSRSTRASGFLTDDPLPRLRDQPRADPLGEPVGDRRGQHDRPAVHPSARSAARTSCCSPVCGRPTARSGVWARDVREPRGRPTYRVRVEAPAALPAELYTSFAAAVA